MILARTTGTVVGLMVGMLLMMGGCGTESSPTAGMGQVILEQTRAVFASSVLPGQEATLDIVGVRTNIPMTVNPDGSVTATVDGVPAGTWTFRVTYRAGSGSARYVIAEASAVGTVVANATTVVRLTTLTNLGAPATAITAKSSHVCASLADGLVSCWGDNNFGQLGNGTMEPSSSPVPVIGLSAPATGVAAGANHSCALLTGGTVACWGANFDGQLGNGTTTPSASPVTVTGLSAPVTAIAAGFTYTCALLTSGTVSCWGANGSGQLGNGTTMRSSIPVAVVNSNGATLTGVTVIAAGSNHTCALLTDGTVACWGATFDGQLGNGTTTPSSNPVTVTGLTTAIAVAAGGSHSCALLTGGTVACWGANFDGQLGNGTTTPSASPVTVTGLSAPVTAIAAGFAHTCAVLTGGTVSCWGVNGSGQLGNGTTMRSSSPVTVTGLATAVDITAGSFNSCARLDDGTVACWGANSDGQLGNGTTMRSSSPVAVVNSNGATLTGVTVIAAGSNHTCALLTDGTVACWGANGSGQLGNGTTTSSSIPVSVAGLTTATAVAAGGNHSCALLTGGTVACWGANFDGQLGNGTTTPSASPVAVTGLSAPVTAIAAGFSHSCARLIGGNVACWGANSDGQLGNGTTTSSSSPVPVAGLAPALEVAAGGSHSCARLSPTTVSCWGANGFGQLGNGTTTSSSSPVPVTGLSAQVFAIAAGLNHSCARLGPTTVSCWGANDSGQLGNGTSTASSSPVTVFNLVGVTGVSTLDSGDAHNCARLNSGTVRCWGSNLSGQLGDETRDTSFIPVMVTGLTTATAVAAGNSHSCARLASGTVSCWGANGSGQLGNGVLLVSPLPVQVVGIP
ncbi:MAG: RCC1 repeat-containing protein [Nitrospiraceae bacterium]